MSVLIKNMVMPDGCAYCSFCHSPVYDSKGEATYFCEVPGGLACDVTKEVVRMLGRDVGEGLSPEWCPLEEKNPGKWMLKPGKYYAVNCSECGYEWRLANSNFCPNCGADMRESNEANRW